MNRNETREQQTTIARLGDVEIERRQDGSIVRISDVTLVSGDKLVIVQRHQKPDDFSKEQLLRSPATDGTSPTNRDYIYNPSTTETGTEKEDRLLSKISEVIGDVDLVATTPQKRGSEHAPLLTKYFPTAVEKPEIDQLADDSNLGLIGESFVGGHSYTPDEASEHFKPGLKKELRFGKGPFEKQRTPMSYMQSWVNFGYQQPGSKWKVENPEELAVRTRTLLGRMKEKNFVLTHEANATTFHMLAERSTDELRDALAGLELPTTTTDSIDGRLQLEAHTLMDLFTIIKDELTDHPVAGFHFKKILSVLLEKNTIRSGDDKKGYGALSLYVVRRGEQDVDTLIEASYDQQIEQ